MKKNELEMAVGILQRLRDYYDSLFDEDGEVQYFPLVRNKTRTQAVQEIRYARRLLLEVEKEL